MTSQTYACNIIHEDITATHKAGSCSATSDDRSEDVDSRQSGGRVKKLLGCVTDIKERPVSVQRIPRIDSTTILSWLQLLLSRNEGSLRDQFVVDLAETDPDWDEAAFEAVLAGETYATQYRQPFGSWPEEPTYTEQGGTYYRLGSVVVDEATAVRPVLRLFGTDSSGDGAPESVTASTLPRSDERAVHVAYLAARTRGNEGGVPRDLVQRGGYVYRHDDAVEDSTLLSEDGPTHVTYRDRTYAVEVSREAFHEPVYRAIAEPVAEDSDRMEAILCVQFVDARLTREELSPDALQVVREAQGEGYSESHPYSDGYSEALTALDARAYLDGNIESDAGVQDDDRQMLRFEGAYHDYVIRFVGQDEG